MISLISYLCEQAWCLPFYPTKVAAKLSTVKNIPNNQRKFLLPDFSGNWQGECNHQKVADLLIKQQPQNISLYYGGISEKYQIGQLNVISSFSKRSSESSSVIVSWAKSDQALVFLHSLGYTTSSGETSAVHFSKSTMQLIQNTLQITTQYFNTPNTVGEVNQETIKCIYTQIR
jgi:hypothetical protein